MQLRRDERQQLQHVFRLGAPHSIKRFLRISFSGHLLGQPSGQLLLAVRRKESHTSMRSACRCGIYHLYVRHSLPAMLTLLQ